MKKSLEQFVENNREAFDTEKPGGHVLKNLQSKLGDKKRSIPFFSTKTLKWAAVIVGLMLISASLYFFLGKEKPKPEIAEQAPVQQEDLGILGDPVYAKQIYHFRELIGLKQEELKQLKKDYPELYAQFVGDITQLDSAYQGLKINLAENPNREMLIEAMIQNLQLQSDLLNQQLLIIKEIKQKTRSHEKNTI